jgi:hypothetical protein
VTVPLGARTATCPYCHTTHLVLGSAGAERLAVRAKVAAPAAREVLETWFAKGWNKDPKLSTEARIGEEFLCYLPFYRVTSDVIGQALGTERRERSTGSGKNRRTEVTYVDVERSVERHCETTLPAVNTAEWGIRRVNLQGDELVAFDGEDLERGGMVFPPTVSAADAFDAAVEGFKAANDPARGLHEVRFRLVATVRDQLAVIFYPLWVVRYEHRGRAYQALVDAEDGTLAYGKAPGNDLYRATMLVACEAAACFVATSAVQWFDEIEPMLGGLAVGALIFYWGWKRFRWGGEIVEGTGTEPDSSLPTGLPKFLSSRMAMARKQV